MNKLELMNKETITVIRKEEDGDILFVQIPEVGYKTKRQIINIKKEDITKLIQFLNQ